MYKEKYLKYKQKYLNLKYGGAIKDKLTYGKLYKIINDTANFKHTKLKALFSKYNITFDTNRMMIMSFEHNKIIKIPGGTTRTEKKKYPCAELSTKRTPYSLSILDIRVANKFAECITPLYKVNEAIDNFYIDLNIFAKDNNYEEYTGLTLDDNSFVQAPIKYDSAPVGIPSRDPKFMWTLLYAFKDPENPSIYSDPANFNNDKKKIYGLDVETAYKSDETRKDEADEIMKKLKDAVDLFKSSCLPSLPLPDAILPPLPPKSSDPTVPDPEDPYKKFRKGGILEIKQDDNYFVNFGKLIQALAIQLQYIAVENHEIYKMFKEQYEMFDEYITYHLETGSNWYNTRKNRDLNAMFNKR
jgi:hypothetical protein